MKQWILLTALAAAMAMPVQAEMPFSLPANAKSYMRPDVDIAGGIDHIASTEGGSSYYSYSATRLNTPELVGKWVIAVEIDGFRNDDGTPWQTDQFRNFYINYFTDFPVKSWDNKAYTHAAIHTDGKAYAAFLKGSAFQIPEGDYGVGFFNDLGTNPPKAHTPVCKNNKGAENGIWTKTLWGTTSGWVNRSAENGPMPVKIYYVDNESDVPETSLGMTLQAPTKVNPVGAGTDFLVKIPVKNTGLTFLTGIDYKVEVDGKVVKTDGNIDAGTCQIGIGMTEVMPFTVPGINEGGEHNVTIIVTKGSKQELETPATVSFKVNVITESPKMPENAVEAGYTDGSEATSLSVQLMHIDACMKFDAKELQGLQIVGAKVEALRQGGLDGFSIWTSNTLGGNRNEEVQAVQFGDEIAALFKTPITITSAGPYIGYSFDIVDGYKWSTPVGGNTGIANSCFIKNASGNWQDFKNYGALTITVFVTGNIPDASLAIQSQTGNNIFAANKPFEVKYVVVNYGKDPITNLTYDYTIGSKTGTSSTTLTTPIGVRLCAPVVASIPFQGQDLDGQQSATIKITQVNGKANASTANSSTCNLRFAQFLPTKRPLMEEMTGTGCGYCPRGIMGVEKLAEKYPEFICAVYHRFNSSDPMYTTNNGPFDGVGAPNSKLDRGEDIDPYYGATGSKPFGIFNDYEEAASIMTPAQIDLVTEWGENKETLKVTASTSFSYTEPGESYKVGYLLIEDGLTGTTAAWKQSSYFTGEKEDDDENLNLIRRGEYDMSKFNHVVIDAKASTPDASTIIRNVVPYQKYNSEITFDIKNNDITQNPDNIKVIAFVVDSKGKVRNAIKAKAGENSAVGITTVEAEQEGPTTYYDLMGRRVQNPQTGLFIKKQGNKASKVIL